MRPRSAVHLKCFVLECWSHFISRLIIDSLIILSLFHCPTLSQLVPRSFSRAWMVTNKRSVSPVSNLGYPARLAENSGTSSAPSDCRGGVSLEGRYGLQRSAKRRSRLLSYSQAQPGRELTQPRKHLLAGPQVWWNSLLKLQTTSCSSHATFGASFSQALYNAWTKLVFITTIFICISLILVFQSHLLCSKFI